MTTADEAMKTMDDMESRMPGNPFALIPGNKYRTDVATVRNQMALVFEQRTANLIAYAHLATVTRNTETDTEIRSRLGIRNTERPAS